MFKTQYEYDKLDDEVRVTITSDDSETLDTYCQLLDSQSIHIENPLVTYPKSYIENIQDSRERIELEHAMAAAYDYCFYKDGKPILHSDPIKLLMNALENLAKLSKENDLLREFAITEPHFLTPVFALYENNELNFSTFTDNRGRKVISLTKYSFKNPLDCGCDFIENNKEFLELITGGKDCINYCDLLKRCIELLWMYYSKEKTDSE